ncbi:MAG: hypothetical protein K2U26_19930, partial [Cyclobacteriaceae bacterium]|nr:hypothetical protein [Cyclobacteriaceae bacterium]
GYQVATIETSVDYQIKLVVLDYYSGKTLIEFPNPDNDLLSMPRWSDDGKKIVALRGNSKGKTITVFDVAQTTSANLIPFSQENIGHPVMYKNFVFFNSPVSGIDNIYALNTETNERFQVTSSKYGAFNPALAPDGKSIFYNEQTRNGMDVVKIPNDVTSWKKIDNVQPPAKSFFQHLVEQEGSPDLLKGVPTIEYKSKRYHRARGMINPHSWGPFLTNSLTQVELGLSSQDILSTTTVDLGYTFDVNERTGAWRAGMSYQGLYPILDVSVSQSNRSVDEGEIEYGKIVKTDTVAVRDNLTFKWEERNVEAGVRVPLLTTSSKYLSRLSFANYAGLTEVSAFKNSIDGTDSRLIPIDNPQYFFRNYVGNGTLLYNHIDVSLVRQLKRSRKDINSKWGQALYMDYFNTPYGGDYQGGQFSVYGLVYLPGLAKHHSLWGHWAYQSTELKAVDLASGFGTDNYTFRNQVPLPRGQSVSRFQDFYSMSANYTLPIWYPDIAIGPLLNIQRLRVNAFFDYGYGKTVFPSRAISRTYTSVGAEVKFDINVMRFLPQFDVGFRYSYGLTPSATRFELLIGSFNF